MGLYVFVNFFLTVLSRALLLKIMVPLKLPGHNVTIQVATINVERDEPSRYIVVVYPPDLKISDISDVPFVHHVSYWQVLNHLLGAQ